MENYVPKRIEYPEVALKEMLRILAAYPDAAWYPYAFSREPLNRKFTDEQRKIWMDKSLACGRAYADIVRRDSGEMTPAKIAEYYGLDVQYPKFPEKTDRVLFGEFYEPNSIRIYMDAVQKAKMVMEEEGIPVVLPKNLEIQDILLAHELFHFIEEQYRKEIFTRREKVKLWSIGVFHYTSSVVALSEIAAMAFAKELCGLTYLPYVLDVFLVYVYSKNEAYGLYDEIIKLQGRPVKEER